MEDDELVAYRHPASEKSLREDNYYEVFIGDKDAIDNPDLMKQRHVVRDSDVTFMYGPGHRRLIILHGHSGAAIGILSSPFARANHIKVLDLIGTPDQVQLAYKLISTIFQLKYNTNRLVGFMPLHVYVLRVPLPSFEVQNLLGVENSKLVKLEEETDAWIQVDETKNLTEGQLLKGIIIYGSSSTQVDAAYEKIAKMVSPGILDEEAENSDSDGIENEIHLSEKHGIMHSGAENETRLSKKRRIMYSYSGAENETQVYNDYDGVNYSRMTGGLAYVVLTGSALESPLAE